jgi:hypothetical protein
MSMTYFNEEDVRKDKIALREYIDVEKQISILLKQLKDKQKNHKKKFMKNYYDWKELKKFISYKNELAKLIEEQL